MPGRSDDESKENKTPSFLTCRMISLYSNDIILCTGDPPDWHKCDVIAKLIANCPSQAESVEEYYSQVAPQVIQYNTYNTKPLFKHDNA